MDAAMASLGASFHPPIILCSLAGVIKGLSKQGDLESNLTCLNLGKLLNLSVSTSANWRFSYLPNRGFMYLSCQGDPATLGPHHYSDRIFFHSLFSHFAPSTLTPMFFKQTRQSLNVESSNPSKENKWNWFIPGDPERSASSLVPVIPEAWGQWTWEVFCRHAYVSFLQWLYKLPQA